MVERQETLFDEEPKKPEVPLARGDDPKTSKLAAASMVEGALKHRALIVDALGYPSKPLTYCEIAERTGLDPVAVNRRLASMRREGLVRRLDETRETPSGRLAHLYTRT